MVLILPLEVLYKIGVLKNFAVFTDSQENTCTRVFVMLQLYWKKTLVQGFSCQFCKIFKNRFGWLLIFYNSYWLYFAIIYSWQLSVSKKSLGIQISFFIFLNFFSFSLTSACLPSQLRKASAVLVLWAVNHFVGSETPKHNDFYQFEKF